MALPQPGTPIDFRGYDAMTVREGYSRFVLREPWPHYVHYFRGHTHYTPPDMFCMDVPRGPSDCVWIVPHMPGVYA